MNDLINGQYNSVEILCEDLSTRQSASPPDVLHRSMAYAVAHDTDAIWIDQECINQDDPVDKEESIQEMDIIYQESDYPIAVLEFRFDTQTQLDAFSSICGDDLTDFDPDQIETLESVLLALNADQWFERAWTLQESVSAGVSMTLLLSCPGLDKPPHFGVTPGEFEISIWQFQNAMVNVRCVVEEGLAAEVWPDSSSAISASNCADVIWNCMPTNIPDHNIGTPLTRDPSHRQICNAAQALAFLGARFNSVFQDRLAILANLCSYECRIDTNVLRFPNASFTVCVHTLAILNGDMSLLGGYEDKGRGPQFPVEDPAWFMNLLENARSEGRLVYPNDNEDMRSNTYGFSWGPAPSSCLSNLIYLEEGKTQFRLKPATLSVQGLRVCGVVWDVGCRVLVPRTQRLFSSKWQEELSFLTMESDMRGNDGQSSLIREFLWCLLQETYSSGMSDLAKTLWNFIQPLGLDPTAKSESQDAPLPYSFDRIFGESAYNDEEKQSAINSIRAPDLWFDPEHRAFNQPLLERLLIEAVCRDGALLCASPVDPHENGNPSSLPRPYAWFEACKVGDKIFTPVTDVDEKNVRPSLSIVREVLATYENTTTPPNLVPLCATISGADLTPSAAYKKLTHSKLSFLFESVAAAQTIGRHSFVGANPRKVLKTGPGHGPEENPLHFLQRELSKSREAVIPGLELPPLTGGAIGYVGYDCIRYFEPRTARPLKDVLQIPESLFMLFDTIVAFDHAFSAVKVITYIHVPSSFTDPSALENAYNDAQSILDQTISILQSEKIPQPPQPPIPLPRDQSTNIDKPGYTSNIGQAGYETHVRTLKDHIWRGNIFQAVPSHRLARRTALHPFNIYSHLRMLNPSPYLFYIDCADFQLVGASPELLAKSENGRVITHPIAGTVKRGKTPALDEELAEELRRSEKDRAEHVMLVDLARNDVNRVCDPHTTKVDRLMVVERFSHVQHLVSQVSGVLRKGKSRFDAFCSIFPAGTVSGAPKVRAMELIAELEGEKRGVYAGAVGYFGYDWVGEGGEVEGEGAMDTCIALRTMLVKEGMAYLQAGGGIVFDSDPGDEWVETMNKLGSNIQCIDGAEEMYRGGDGGSRGRAEERDGRGIEGGIDEPSAEVSQKVEIAG
ncbi:MAG: hypothetical protein Q9219_001372 [cf. Caloplaca sp. 3 TL-2023]